MNLLEILCDAIDNNAKYKDPSDNNDLNELSRKFKSVSSRENPYYEEAWKNIAKSNRYDYSKEETDKIRNYLAELYGGWLFNMNAVDKILYDKKEMLEMRKI